MKKMQASKHTTKVERITKDRYERADHYRAQVQLNEKLVWAICYGSIFDNDRREAGRLRDSLAEAIERVVIEHFRALIKQHGFRWFFSKWYNETVDDDMKQAADAFLKQHFGEFFL